MPLASSRSAENLHTSNPLFDAEKSSADPMAEAGVAEQPFFQAKLSIAPPNDRYEQQADAAADHVTGAETEAGRPFFTSPPVPVQRREEDLMQTRPIFESPGIMDLHSSRSEQLLQGKEAARQPSAAFERQLDQSKGRGTPLPETTRSRMESGIGADFNSVRVHTDHQAVQMNRDIGAQAFAHGNDIYFDQGRYAPETAQGDHLLAHELTHTVQQEASSIHPRLIQRQAGQSPGNPPTPTGQVWSGTPGSIDYGSAKLIRIPELGIPSVKDPFTPSPHSINFNDIVDRIDQREDFRLKFTLGSGFDSRFQQKVRAEQAPDIQVNGNRIYYLKLKGVGGLGEGLIMGTQESIKQAFVLPFWNRRGIPTSYDVDHQLERQLGGGNAMNNYWLLEASANRSSGGLINAEINRRIKAVLDGAKDANHTLPCSRSEWYRVKGNGYRLEISQKIRLDRRLAGRPNDFWTVQSLQDGEPLSGLRMLNRRDVEQEGLLLQDGATPTHILVLPRPFGGNVRRIRWTPNGDSVTGLDERVGNFTIEEVHYQPGGSNNRIVGKAFKRLRGQGRLEHRGMSIPLLDSDTVQFGGVVDQSSIMSAVLGTFQFRGMSPITISSMTFEPNQGLVGGGQLLPSLPFLNDLDIQIAIDEEGIQLEKTFTAGDINIPRPFSISDASLTVSVGTAGLEVSGGVQFGIERVGEGSIEGFVDTNGNFGVRGSFNFDSQLFNPASVRISYENNVFSVGGTLGIPRGKVTGIRSAAVDVNYSEGNLSASGSAQLDVPGVQEGTFNVSYSNDRFSIGGSFQLRSDIPGIRSGSVSAQVTKVEGEEGYQVTASGTAVPAIPGINSSLTVTYDNGALTVSGQASYNRGLLSGSVQVGATNRTIGEDGQPSGPPGDSFTVYGGGSLTLRITPWLSATAAVRFLPNGEIEVTGRIGLPNVVDVFARKSIRRNLFSIPQIEIPLFAIPLGPRSLGLVATINGGLDFEAGFGPGQIRELFGEVTYNPDHPELTTLRAGGRFVIPADAGLSLRADLGLGLSIGIASLTGGIEIAGTLGLAGDASASINVEWSPQSGLELHARGEVNVRPKFTFDVNLLARAALNLPWPLPDLSKTWRHNLFRFQWGPDIVFGIAFPIDYIEGQPFDVSFDDIQVTYPELNIGQMATGLARSIKDRVF